MERRSLFNALRMNNKSSGAAQVEDWRVFDYRTLSLKELFTILGEFNIHLDRDSFLIYAEQCDTPEELADNFVADTDCTQEYEDRLYLIIFELWRRLLPEKRCLSIFCDELDHQIHAYDTHAIDTIEGVEDAIANLTQALEDHSDAGDDPRDLFATVCDVCANHVEEFLYDFISERIDDNNIGYASELVDDYIEMVSDPKWFHLLKLRIISATEPTKVNKALQPIVKKGCAEGDLDFNFELLNFLVQEGESHMFVEVALKTLPLLETEQDFVDLLRLTAAYYQCLDQEKSEAAVEKIIRSRSSIEPDQEIDPKAIQDLKKILS